LELLRLAYTQYVIVLSIVLSYLILSYYLFYYLLAFIQLNREIISGCNKIPLDLSILFKNSVWVYREMCIQNRIGELMRRLVSMLGTMAIGTM